MKKILALMLAMVLALSLFTACGGGKGSLKGEWVPVSDSVEYKSIKFSGSKITLDSGYGEAMTVTYTYKNNTLTIIVQGYPSEIPLEMGKVGKIDVLRIDGVEYAHPEDKDKVAGADANGEGNFVINENPTKAANNSNIEKDPTFKQFAKLPKVKVEHKVEIESFVHYVVGSSQGRYEIQNGNLYDVDARDERADVLILEGAKLIRRTIGDSYFVLKTNGELWGFGSNNNGRLGDGTAEGRNDPVKIMDGVLDVITASSSRYNRVYALKTDNTLWHWGEGILAPEQIAADVAEICSLPGDKAPVAYLKTNGDLEINGEVFLKNVKEVPAFIQDPGYYKTLLIMSDNAAYYFPRIADLELDSEERLWNEKVYENVKNVTVAGMTAYVLTNSGELMGRGDNSKGELGTGTNGTLREWVKIADGVESYGRGYTHQGKGYQFYYIKTDGSVWAWGSSNGGRYDDFTPQRIAG